MKTLVRSLSVAMAMAGVLSGFATTNTHAQTQAPALAVPQAQIYLVRGLFGVFSLGMDQLALKLKEQGFEPRLVGWEQWGVVANEILANNRRGDSGQIILIGHSLGADSTIQIASNVAKENVPIDLIVTFDTTQPLQVPNNVVHFINFFQENGVGKRMVAESGFQGQLSNIDLSADRSLDHLNIDESARLQQIVVNKVFEVTFQQAQQVPSRRKTIAQ
jgi:hypothetical protein